MALILVAEDDPDISELLFMLVEELGHDAVLASDGAAALHQAGQSLPDAAILDVGLPGGISGLDVTRALREGDATSHLPILLLTARADEEDVAAGYAAGASGYLVKPFFVEDLVEMLEAMLNAPRP